MNQTKDKDAVLDYAFDWTAWLSAGETITSATVAVQTGLEKDRAVELADGKATVWLAGGTVGESYTVTCHVVTSQGREDDRSMRVRVAER